MIFVIKNLFIFFSKIISKRFFNFIYFFVIKYYYKMTRSAKLSRHLFIITSYVVYSEINIYVFIFISLKNNKNI